MILVPLLLEGDRRIIPVVLEVPGPSGAAVPLVESDWSYTDYDYYTLIRDYYRVQLDQMSLKRPLSTIHLGSTPSEYAFTVESDQPQAVYALTGAYLYYLKAGQTSNLLNGATATEPMLILEPLPSSKLTWQSYLQEYVPMLEHCVYFTIHLGSASHKNELSTFLTETLFQEVHYWKTGRIDLPLRLGPPPQ